MLLAPNFMEPPKYIDSFSGATQNLLITDLKYYINLLFNQIKYGKTCELGGSYNSDEDMEKNPPYEHYFASKNIYNDTTEGYNRLHAVGYFYRFWYPPCPWNDDDPPEEENAVEFNIFIAKKFTRKTCPVNIITKSTIRGLASTVGNMLLTTAIETSRMYIKYPLSHSEGAISDIFYQFASSS
jgi:hypothetical protein